MFKEWKYLPFLYSSSSKFYAWISWSAPTVSVGVGGVLGKVCCPSTVCKMYTITQPQKGKAWVGAVSKMVPNDPTSRSSCPVWSPLTLYQGWTMWAMERGRRDGVALWDQIIKHDSLPLCLLPLLFPVFFRPFALEERAGRGGLHGEEPKLPVTATGVNLEVELTCPSRFPVAAALVNTPTATSDRPELSCSWIPRPQKLYISW